MPSLQSHDVGSGGSGGGWKMPWKVLASIALIACSGWYGLYQYERYFPSKKSPIAKAAASTRATAAGKQEARKREEARPLLEKLNLTAEQRSKLTAIDSMSTDSQSKIRLAAKALTHEQRLEMRRLRADVRKVAQEKADARKAKYFPNAASAAAASQGQKAIQEQRAARKQAAESAAQPQQEAKQ